MNPHTKDLVSSQACFLAIVVLGSFVFVFTAQSYFGSKHYWNGPGIEMPLGAPDGVYDVLPNFFDTYTVNFPICSHSYGHLHGSWQYDNCSGKVWFPTSEGWLHPCFVKLQNNTVVEAWLKSDGTW